MQKREKPWERGWCKYAHGHEDEKKARFLSKQMADQREYLPAWCDIQRNIGAVHVTLSLHGVRGGEAAAGATNRKVRILPGKIFTTNTNPGAAKNSVCVQLAGVSVIPESCNELCVIQGKELHIRFQLDKHQSDGAEVCERLVRREQQQLRIGTHTVCCRTCGNVILHDNIQFIRVLELPTENWQELAKEWCCHANSLPNMAVSPLNPGPGDCLVGDHYILLHPSAMELNSLIITLEPNSPGVKCARCRSTLGDTMVEEGASLEVLGSNSIAAVQIYKHSICIAGKALFRSYSTEGFISRSLLSRTKGAVNFKFIIQGPSKNKTVKTFAMLWLLNLKATVVTNVQRWFPNDCCYLTESETSSNAAQSLQVLKVLYKVCSHNTVTEQQEWLEDPAVQFIIFSRELCLELLVILTANTCTLPSTARTMDGFQVGYLRM